jgi:hypothetical protein
MTRKLREPKRSKPMAFKHNRENGAEKKRLFFELIPMARKFSRRRVTLDTGIKDEVDQSGRLMRCAQKCS